MNNVLLKIYDELGIQQQHLDANRLTFHEQPPLAELQVIDIDFEGRPFILHSSVAQAWIQMKSAAKNDQVALLPFSGFRSYLHQKILIERNLRNGRTIKEILTHIAIPGFSEHHSGRAIDIHAEGRTVLDEGFEETDAFLWLKKNADGFGFQLSYPRDNASAIIYEPWHWFYKGAVNA